MCLTLLCAIVSHRPMSEKRHDRGYRGSQKQDCGLGYMQGRRRIVYSRCDDALEVERRDEIDQARVDARWSIPNIVRRLSTFPPQISSMHGHVIVLSTLDYM